MEEIRLIYWNPFRVANREQCLSACLKEREFVCRSVNYNYDSAQSNCIAN